MQEEVRRHRFGMRSGTRVELRPATSAATRSEPAKATPRPDFDDVADLREAVDSHERAIVEHALGKHRWNQRQTAKALGLSYDQLRHCIKKHGLMEETG